MDRIGAAEANLGDTLLMMQSRAAGGQEPIFVLLSVPSFSPKFQDFTKCQVVSGARGADGALQFPIHLKVASAQSRLQLPGGGTSRVIEHCTSDELCKAMAMTSSSWDFCVAEYAVTSALGMRVDGSSVDARLRATVDRSAPGPSQPKDSLLRDAVMVGSLGDPFAGPSRPATSRHRSGRGGGSAVGGGSGGSKRGRSSANPLPPASDSVAAEDGGIYEDDERSRELAFDVMVASGMDAGLSGAARGELLQEDGSDSAGEDHIAGDPAPDASAASVWMEEAARSGDGGGLQVANSSSSSSSNNTSLASGPMVPTPGALANSSTAAGLISDAAGVAVEVLALVAEAIGAAEAESEQPAQQAAAAEGLAAEQLAAGSPPAELVPHPVYGLPVPPGGPEGWTMSARGHCWTDRRAHAGRITAWGPNISAKCAFHQGGCMLAVSAKKWSKVDLLNWLATGVPLTGPGQMAEHKKCWPLG